MATASGNTRRPKPFFPKADAAILTSRHGLPPARPRTVWPVFDPDNVDRPIGVWTPEVEKCFYPPKVDEFAASSIPDEPMCIPDKYLRAFLAENERLRSSMLWYYTRDILSETEFLSGLQEKAHLAQESTGWEFVVIGILDVNYYIRLASIGLPLAILPRGETLCAHTVTQPPGNVFLLPNMMEDWRFRNSPYVESGGLRAYAGAPLRLQNESGDCVSLGSLCVTSRTKQEPLTKSQQQTLARLADWVVADIVQCARARRQRDRRRMSELISSAQAEAEKTSSEEPILRILRATYPDAAVNVQSSKEARVEIEDHDPIPLADFDGGLWEDTDYLDDFINNSNQKAFPSTRVVRAIVAPCDTLAGPSSLLVASKDFRLVFDDVDSWFVYTCATMLSQVWHKRLLTEVMRAKEKFLRGISHQLRTPIHGILGSVDLLAEELLLRKQRESKDATSLPAIDLTAKLLESTVYLDTIKSAGRDLMSIVNNMITLNRWADIAMTSRHYAEHTINDLEMELGNELRKTTSDDTRYKASVFFHHDPLLDCVNFRTDLGLLRDSLVPIIINAIQNTPKGIITVTTSIDSDYQQLIVDVEDTGRGIHPDHHERIFEPYEKVEMHSLGAGLGLTIASRLATLLHGSVSLVSSDVNRGSHFKATFQEMECARVPLLSQPLAQKFNTLPSKFYNMTTGSDNTLLFDRLTRFLAWHGFKSSDSLDGSFAILDFVSDLKKHRSNMSQIPSGYIALCLVPASEGKCFLDQTSKNIIYLSAPFLPSTISSALEEADKYLSNMRISNACTPRPDDSSINPLDVPTDLSTENEDKPSTCPNEQVAQPIAGNPAQTGLITPPVEINYDASIPTALTISTPTALLVDDNVINLRILQMYCTKRGLPYHCATDGLQAVEIFSRQQSLATAGKGAGIHLIFMDLQMPVCDGFKATQQIRQLEKQNKWGQSIMFIVTGQDSPADKSTAEDVGADEYLVKPVGIKVLDRNVARHFPKFKAG
ncbi:histidine kinase HHK3 [Trichoderma guizhouense]|uniref:histidine kinase n=1 Tax=Trichoderma guizhouense TaxID=1491466 RepID=A0A1T3CJI9_9HYPO|nr:histidine kinase HHK3 [Trichoderma guizhouense]